MEGCAYGTMVKEIIRKEINTCLAEWFKIHHLDVIPLYTLEEPPKHCIADLSINLAMVSAGELRKSPRAVAQDISALLLKHANKSIISSIEIAGPGFINITLGEDIYTHAVNYPARVSKLDESNRVLIEFVSANPTGPLHIGHGRGAALGDSLARIMRHIGYTVDTEYYVNDIGNQIETLGASVTAHINQSTGEAGLVPDDGYHGEYIIDIARKFLLTKKQHTQKNIRAYAVDDILGSIREDCERFGVGFNNWFFESHLHEGQKQEKVLEQLLKSKHLYERDGAVWLKSTASGDEKDRVVKRADGRYTYLASDISYHADKLSRGYTRLINIWGADHHGYVKRVQASLAALGASEDILGVVLYQLVSLSRGGKPVSMSTRAGQFVTLREVLDEVGTDACRFFFALRSPNSQLEFDLELAKKHSNENPVFYVQYVHARICSIFREAEKNNSPLAGKADLKLLSTAEERALMKKLAFFNDTILLCVNETSPHHLTRYLLDLAGLFHKFYDTCRVLTDNKQLTSARLMLIEAVKKTMATGLELLGVSAPEQM